MTGSIPQEVVDTVTKVTSKALALEVLSLMRKLEEEDLDPTTRWTKLRKCLDAFSHATLV